MILNQNCNVCVLKMNRTISHQINETCKPKSSMSKKYYWGFYALFWQDNPIQIFIHSWYFTRMQIKKGIYRASQRKLPLYVLLNIPETKGQNYKPFFSPSNWDLYANFEYKTNSVWYQEAEIFVKQNRVLKHINA